MGLTLSFLGTRGEIELRTTRHRRHSALLVVCAGARVMVDCGTDWLGRLRGIQPDAILLTHAHPDHVGGLSGGAPCPVYATAETLARVGRYGLGEGVVVVPRHPLELLGIQVEAFSLDHSLRAPAVGYRLAGGGASLFYAPDVLAIHEQGAALRGAHLYVGDGASPTRSIVRRRLGAGIGHASIRRQLDWCAAEGVPRAIFTHCGSQVVRGNPRAVAALVSALGRERGVRAEIASDGLTLEIGEETRA